MRPAVGQDHLARHPHRLIPLVPSAGAIHLRRAADLPMSTFQVGAADMAKIEEAISARQLEARAKKRAEYERAYPVVPGYAEKVKREMGYPMWCKREHVYYFAS